MPFARKPFLRDADASVVHLPAGPWSTVLDALCARFIAISREQWLDRMMRGRVLDAQGRSINATTPFQPHQRVHYYREVVDEAVIPFVETVLQADEHLVVADKPHFLPVIPSGGFVEQTLLRRLMRQLDNPDLAPLHRIDRGTAGLVMFSACRETRSAYQALFQQRRIEKRYEALAPALPQLAFPLLKRSRMVTGEPFFRMREVEGEPNSETRIEVIDRGDAWWRYALYPVSGKKHQLRVHMASLGAAIVNDDFYPSLTEVATGDHRHPLKLLAQALAFVDPLSGEPRRFESRLQL
ncbi:MAG: RluA family pseudouridine synthase [Pseudomonadota bacterium]|nr:RluA family pseudouridine synthase [Pseudomonadota bacterium]